ncbi:MAG: hypothetical protein LBT86_07685 [Deltaproteobacteria bacterium]|nr:hypothetical protein [Deltaproteobacteria bacterium]
MNIISLEQFRRDYPEALLNKCRMDTTREARIKFATRLSRRGDTIDDVVELSELSRDEVVAIKAQVDAAGRQEDSPPPAAF